VTAGPSQGRTGPRVHDEARHRFEETLEDIKQGMVRMASLVLENARRAGEAVVQSQLDLVDQVRGIDEDVNQMYSELERTTFETLARQQPVASDLRFLVSTTRILYELERTGDLAVNLVNILERQEGFAHHSRLTPALERVVAASCKVFAQSIDVLADMDADAGAALDAADDEVDGLVSEFYALVGAHSEEIGLENAIAYSRLGRFLERIGDHAVNVGENVAYIVTAKFPGDTHASLRDEAD
jgi:phosphate transport system protein